MNEQNYKYLVRLPPQLKEQLHESAEYYRRSINSDIVARLQHSFSGLPDARQLGAITPPMHHEINELLHRDLTTDERLLIRHFRNLTAAKRTALMDLLA